MGNGRTAGQKLLRYHPQPIRWSHLQHTTFCSRAATVARVRHLGSGQCLDHGGHGLRPGVAGVADDQRDEECQLYVPDQWCMVL